MKYIFEVKKQGVTQGSSLLEANLVGYTMQDFVKFKRWKSSGIDLFQHVAIQVLNAISLYKFWWMYQNDEKLKKKDKSGTNNAGGNRTAHMWHGLSILDGLGVSYLTK